MKAKDVIKQYIPLALLTILAAMVILLGVVSAANAQNNVGGEVIAGPEAQENMNKRSDIFQPLIPHQNAQQYGRFTPRDDTRPTRIGRAGQLPEETVRAPQQPQPTLKLDEMPSLSDNAGQNRGDRLGPTDMSMARRAGDIQRMATRGPAPIPDFEELMLNNQHIRTAEVQVRLEGDKKEEEVLLSWRMNPVEYPVFIKKVHALNPAMSGNVPVEDTGTAYNGVEIRLVDEEGRTYQPVYVNQNRVKIPGKQYHFQDSNRDLETWTLGTAKRHDQREMIASLIDVMSYAQCKALGHTLVDAVPRQCILPDGTTFIEIDERITEKDREITSFEKCLKAGHPIVDTFPRKCVAPGGRVYVEPPQL